MNTSGFLLLRATECCVAERTFVATALRKLRSACGEERAQLSGSWAQFLLLLFSFPFTKAQMRAFLIGACLAAQAHSQIVPTSGGRTLPGPASPEAQPAWLASVNAWRATQRAAVNYSGAVYDTFLLWSPTLFIAPQSHIYDRFL